MTISTTVMEPGKKIYFASDFHLGMDGRVGSRERELQLLRWMDQIAGDACELFLVGDLFDFWFFLSYYLSLLNLVITLLSLFFYHKIIKIPKKY